MGVPKGAAMLIPSLCPPLCIEPKSEMMRPWTGHAKLTVVGASSGVTSTFCVAAPGAYQPGSVRSRRDISSCGSAPLSDASELEVCWPYADESDSRFQSKLVSRGALDEAHA